jgi:site-specific recombinase XerD
MANEDIRMLVQAIGDYLKWVKSIEEHGRSLHTIRYSRVLTDFLLFAINKDMVWKDMFTLDTLEGFRKHSTFKNAPRALIAISYYLFSHGRLDQPIKIIKISKPQKLLPDIYEHYLLYHEQGRQLSHSHLRLTRMVLSNFHRYLQRHNIELSRLSIEHLDAFMAELKMAHSSKKNYRTYLRGFLMYLYQERKILKKNLAPLLVTTPLYGRSKPPKFLRPREIQKLFANLKLSTPLDIRTYAMVHLAYTLGLRPVEISRITLDDISFQKGELAVPDRKGGNPITLPIPENTIKSVAAYCYNARPKGTDRHLFLTFHYPYLPVSSTTVTYSISKAMKQAGLHSTPYWLRHTYAQNLLHIGQSIYEIKEMLGHDNIQSSNRYITIHTELMRKVLFDEEL